MTDANGFDTYDDSIRSGNRIALLLLVLIMIFFLGTIFVSANPIPIRPDALVAGYSFNGDANDFVGSNNGTVNGATLTTNRFGQANKAYDFNGSQYISELPLVRTEESFSIGLWINPSEIATHNILSSYAGTSHLALNLDRGGTRKFEATIDSTLLPTNIRLDVNDWTFAVLTYDTTTSIGKVYLGGELVYTSGTITKIAGRTIPLALGGFNNNGSISGQFKGQLDDVLIYNEALSEDEVLALYQYGRLVGGYGFDGDANDVSYNENNGVVNGATLTENRFGEANKAYDFNGDPLSLRITTDLNDFFINTSYGNFSVSGWFYTRESGTTQGLFGNKYDIGSVGDGTGFGVYISNTNQIVTRHGGAIGSGFYPDLNKWNHVVLVKDNNTIQLYFNNIGSSNTSAPYNASNNRDFIIGNDGRYNVGREINGKIDDVAIFDYALSESEVEELFLRGNYLDEGDWVLPETSFTSEQVSGTTDQNITLSCSDDNTGCKAINYNVNNEGWEQISYNSTIERIIRDQNDLTADKTYLFDTDSYDTTLNSICAKWETTSSEKGTMKYVITYEDDTTADSNTFTDNSGSQNKIICFSGWNTDKTIKSILLDHTTAVSWDAPHITDQNINTTRNFLLIEPYNYYSFLYSGTGDHNIQYFSTDNADNNEAINTSSFTTYGLGKFTFYDEDDDSLLNDVVWTVSPSIGGVSGGTLTDTNVLDLNLQGITSTTYTFTFSKDDYGTRYYISDLTQYSDINIGFLMLPDTNGQNIQFKFFAPNKTTILSNSWVTITNSNKNNFTTGRLKTDSQGIITYFLDTNSGYHQFNITNTPTGTDYDYNSISVTINKPKDEETSTTIDAAWNLTISGVTASTYTDITAGSTTLALYSNTVNEYIFQIDSNSTIPEYSARKYYLTFKGNDTSYTLQPYLLASASAITIYTQNSLLTPISGVQIDIYRVTSSGYTLIEQIQTDASGSAGVSLKANQDYFFDVFYEGETYFLKERKQITSAKMYFILSVEENGEYTPSTNLILKFVPGYQQLTTISYDRTINMTPTCTGLTITSFDVNVTQTTDINTTILYTNTVASNVCGITQSFDIDDDLNIPDSNYPIKVFVTIVTSEGTQYFEKYYNVLTSAQEQYNLIYILQNNLFEDMGCTRTGNPLIDLIVPCPTLLLIIAGLMLFTAVGVSKKVNVDKIGIILLIELGFFVFIGWFPIASYALIVFGSIILIGVSNFNW